ncbi:pentapeptide repeat-containing protein [Kitasatospora nipponensis]|uniref:pentapeptide repeat-containing protein n=1 Tax=Kitasatospora nipponensis TaxID=258049 RepID=UPI003CD07A32
MTRPESRPAGGGRQCAPSCPGGDGCHDGGPVPRGDRATRARLSGARLSGARLSGARLGEARLRGGRASASGSRPGAAAGSRPPAPAASCG